MFDKGQDSGQDAGDKSLFYKRLEAGLKKLIKSINRLGYTRNTRAMASAAEHCAEVERQLRQFDSQRLAVSPNAFDDWLVLEAHQLLAEARRLLQAPLHPTSTDGNVITLQPDYKCLTDAAFERMLASSDIPRLLSSPLPQPEDQFEEHQEAQAPANKPAALRLVFSRDD